MNLKPDPSGWAHALQLHPDGTAAHIAYETSSLPRSIRWLCWTGDQRGLELALPSTSGVEGYSVEKAAGRIAEVPPGGHWQARMRLGRLDPGETKAKVRRINVIAGREAA